MSAVGGLVGVTQNDASLALEPVAGWAVSEAAPLDALLFNVKTRVSRRLPSPLQAPTLESSEVRQSYLTYMPDDLDRFFQEFGDCVELSQHGSALPIVFKFLGRADALEWNEEKEEHGSSYGPLGRSWFKFADLPNSRFLVINLDPNCPGRYRDEKSGAHIPYELRGPIAVCSEGTIGKTLGNPVISLSFSELLNNLLYTDSATGYFWDDERFEPYGEAHELTRVASKR